MLATLQNKINLLEEIKQRNIRLNLLNGTDKDERKLLLNFKKDQTISEETITTALKYPEVIELFNNDDLEGVKAFNCLAKGPHKPIKNANAEIVSKAYKLKHSSAHKYSSFMYSIIKALCKYNITDEKMIEKLNHAAIFFEYKNMYYESYQDIQNNIKAAEFALLCIMNNIEVKSNPCIFINTLSDENLKCLKEVMKTEGIPDTTWAIFKTKKPIKPLYKYLLEIKNKVNKDVYYLVKTYTFKNMVLNEKDLSLLNKRLDYHSFDGIPINLIDILMFIYPQYKKFLDIYKNSALPTDLILYACRNKKKAFLRLLCELKKEEVKLPVHLLDETFRKYVNLNTLTRKNIEELRELADVETLDILLNVKLNVDTLTFKEYKLLQLSPEWISRLYNNLTGRIDYKIKVINELKDVKSRMSDESIKTIANKLNEQPLSVWMKDLKHLNFTVKEQISLLIKYDNIKKYIPQLKTTSDIAFILKLDKPYLYPENLDDAKEMYYKDSTELNELLRAMDLSEDFIKQNKRNIYDFASRGLVEVVDTMFNSYKLQPAQKKNLLLLAKAEMTGQIEKIKFYGNDLDLEIGYTTSNEVKESWMENKLITTKNFSVEETYDFETTIRMGQDPVSTCMNWKTGMYNECLLSMFDTNKKLLIAKNKTGKKVGRAIIRLTKGSNEFKGQFNASNSLSFRDIEKIDDAVKKDNNEKLILFLEKPYVTECNDGLRYAIYRKMVELAKEKAKELGAILVVSNYYNKANLDDFRTEFKRWHVYISHSKNGKQYLDSFQGNATVQNEGTFKCGKFTTIYPE
ncbi:MAG: hypothetical protein ACOCRK_02195 [bacterium]